MDTQTSASSLHTQEGTEPNDGTLPEPVAIEAAVDQPHPKKKRVPKEAQPLTRDPGKSLLPFSRVQKILKADKELPLVAREATYLISLATEEFIKHIAEESGIVASRENRVTVQYKDIASVVRRVEKFMFLDEIIPLQDPDPPARRKPKPTKGKDGDKQRPGTTLDSFIAKGKKVSGADVVPETADEDIVMNDDGTMTVDPQQ